MHNRAPPEPFLVQYLCEEISPPVVLDHQGADDEEVEGMKTKILVTKSFGSPQSGWT